LQHHQNPVNQHRLAHFEDCQSAIDQLFIDAMNDRGESAFDEFIDFAIRFSNLAVYNAMLVRIQCPGAGAVATRRKWNAIGREIKPGATPIVILRPFGPVEFVFEQSDTEGADIRGEKQSSLFADGEISEQTFNAVVAAAKKNRVLVEHTPNYGALLAGTAQGYKMLPDAKSGVKDISYSVLLNANHDLPTRFATMAHELGHVYCGHIGGDIKGRWAPRIGLPHELVELEAEAVAFLVCQRNGVTSRSREYLSQLIRKADLGAVSMYAIYEAANRVESRTPPK
jgi:hypothetical protein